MLTKTMKKKLEIKPLRYAHAEGHTHLCFTEEGQHIITCGHDGDVRIWLGIEDDEPNSHCVGENATSVCCKEGRLYVATDNNLVQAYTFPAFDKDGIVTRFTASITQVCSSSKTEGLGCACENGEAKICNPEGGEPLLVMADHKGPVLSIALCPHMKYASTASGDGSMRIWDIDTQKILKEIPCVPKINTFFAAKVLCRMHFEPSEGKYLAYPNNREVALLECDSWAQRMVFTHNSIKCAVSQCLFSPCGQYLAASTIAGQIIIWEVQSGTCMGVAEHPTSHNVSAMAWNPKGNGVLAYCDVAGQLGTLLNCYGKDSSKYDEDDETESVTRDDDLVDDLIQNYESDDENAISLERIKNETLGLVTEDKESRPPSRETVLQPSSVPPQPAFQPSSTPSHLDDRYLCWNDIGIVRCHNDSNGESNIDVEFHDTTMHQSIHLNNYLNHTMASLSSTVLALACEMPSKLVCITLVGSRREWSVSLPESEEAACVSAASALVACATTSRLLRLYTPLGTQLQVVSLTGPVVTLASYNTSVFAVYHAAEPGVSDQHLAMDIIAMNGRQVRSRSARVALGAGARLAWLGASEAGSPCAFDSAGVLRLYDLAAGLWLPLCDTTQHSRGVSDTWFLVSVNEQTQKVRAILCRGATFPPTLPKPIITELPIQMPLCELESEKSQYEEQLVRWAHVAADTDVKTARETALKLFALACRSEIEHRAVELMELLRDEQITPLAAKYASRLGKVHLAEKLTDMLESWQRDSNRLNEAQNSHFAQLESQETQSESATQDGNTSVIIPITTRPKQNDETPIKPVIMKQSPGGVRNPFKKKQDSAKSVPSPLTLTDRILVDSSTQGLEENSDPMKPIEGETFVQWFERNRTTLEQQNPDLAPGELSRLGVRTFKSVHNTGFDHGQKRKLDEDVDVPPVANAPKQSKLSAFIYQKKEA